MNALFVRYGEGEKKPTFGCGDFLSLRGDADSLALLVRSEDAEDIFAFAVWIMTKPCKRLPENCIVQLTPETFEVRSSFEADDVAQIVLAACRNLDCTTDSKGEITPGHDFEVCINRGIRVADSCGRCVARCPKQAPTIERT